MENKRFFFFSTTLVKLCFYIHSAKHFTIITHYGEMFGTTVISLSMQPSVVLSSDLAATVHF